jgi:hypothetical protein
MVRTTNLAEEIIDSAAPDLASGLDELLLFACGSPECTDPFRQLVIDACEGDVGALQLVQVDCQDELDAIERAHCDAYLFWRPGTVLTRFWNAMRAGHLTMPRGVGPLAWLRTTFTNMVLAHVGELKRLPDAQ